MVIDLTKPMTELTVAEYAWLLVWQAKHVTGTPVPAYTHVAADKAVESLGFSFDDELRRSYLASKELDDAR